MRRWRRPEQPLSVVIRAWLERSLEVCERLEAAYRLAERLEDAERRVQDLRELADLRLAQLELHREFMAEEDVRGQVAQDARAGLMQRLRDWTTARAMSR
jgi:hypothetical protein